MQDGAVGDETPRTISPEIQMTNIPRARSTLPNMSSPTTTSTDKETKDISPESPEMGFEEKSSRRGY